MLELINLLSETIEIYKSYCITVNLGIMAMKEYSTLPGSPELEPHYQMKSNVITETSLLEGVLLFCWGVYGQHILSPNNTTVNETRVYACIYQPLHAGRIWHKVNV